jgi:hypothetical protein
LPLVLAGFVLKTSNAEGQFRTGEHASFSLDSQANSASTVASEKAPSTSTDLFVMAGSDFDRTGMPPRANYNIGKFSYRFLV